MVTFYDENVTKHHIKCRECNGLPWGFPGQPAPVPVETHTCGCVRVMGLVKPRGSQTHRGLGCPCPRLPYPNFIVIAIITCIYYNKHMLVYKNTRKRKRRNSLMAQMTCIWRRLGFFLSGSYHSVSHSLGNCLYRCLIPAQKINETDTAGKPLTWISCHFPQDHFIWMPRGNISYISLLPWGDISLLDQGNIFYFSAWGNILLPISYIESNFLSQICLKWQDM